MPEYLWIVWEDRAGKAKIFICPCQDEADHGGKQSLHYVVNN